MLPVRLSVILVGALGCTSAPRPATPAAPAPVAAATPAPVAPPPAPPPPPLRIDQPVLDAVWVDATHLALHTANALYRLDITTQHLDQQPDFHLRPKLDQSLSLGTQLAQVSSFPQWEPKATIPHYTIDIYDLATLARVRTIAHGGEIIAWSTSHALYVQSTCGDDQRCSLAVTEALTGAVRLTAHGGNFPHAELSPDDRHLIVRDRAHRRIYRIADGKLVIDANLPTGDEFHGTVELIVLDGDRAVLTARNVVWVYDLVTGKRLGRVVGKPSPVNYYGRSFDPSTGILTLTALPSTVTVIDTRKLVVRGTARLPASYDQCLACVAFPVGEDAWANHGERLPAGAKAFEPAAGPAHWVSASAVVAPGVTSILVGIDSEPARCTWTTGPRVVADLPCPAPGLPEDYVAAARTGAHAISPDGARIAIVDRGILTIADGTSLVTLGAFRDPRARHTPP